MKIRQLFCKHDWTLSHTMGVYNKAGFSLWRCKCTRCGKEKSRWV